MAQPGTRAQDAGMVRRTLAVILWGYFAWYLVNLVAATWSPLPAWLGFVTGVSVAGAMAWRLFVTIPSSSGVARRLSRSSS
jgi:hypothetical protein